MSISKIVVLFVTPAANHWVPRLAAGTQLEVEAGTPPTVVGEDLTNIPPQLEGVIYLVNARVGAVFASHPAETRRNDVYVLPVGAPQDDSPVGLDFLVKI